MKTFLKIIVFFLCGILLLFVARVLIESSHSVSINTKEWHMHPNYTLDPEVIPVEYADEMYLSNFGRFINNKSFIGKYRKIKYSETHLTNGHSIGLNSDSLLWENQTAEEPIYLIFVENNKCMVFDSANESPLILLYSFKKNKLKIYDESNRFDTYLCHFTYSPSFSWTENEKDETKTDIESEMDDGDEKDVDPNGSPQGDEGFWEYIKNSFFTTALNRIWLLFFFFIGLFLVFGYLSIILTHIYPRKLLSKLFQKEHNWLSNNNSNDIYISVKVKRDGVLERTSLLEFFSSALLRDATTYAILGEAGEGKTFSLSKLAFELASGKKSRKSKNAFTKRKWVPVILNFSSFSRTENKEQIIKRIYEEICIVLGNKYRFFSKPIEKYLFKAVVRCLQSGKFILMFDGYDEIANQENRLFFSRVLSEFMEEYNKCNYIITSRTHVYRDEPFQCIKEENTLTIIQLSKDQIWEFLSRLSYPENKSATELYLKIINSAQLEGVVSNPLLLSMIAHTYCVSSERISGSRVDLYTQCCRCLLETWENKKVAFFRISRRYNTVSAEIKQELLGQLANYLYIHETNSITERALLHLWANQAIEKQYFHGKAKKVLTEIIEESGIIEKTSNNSLRFRHRSFYEYFAAWNLFTFGFDNNRIFAKINDEQNLLFFFLCMQENEDLIISFLTSTIGCERLFQEIILERKINDLNVVESAVNVILRKADYHDETQMLKLGFTAKQYANVSETIKNNIMAKLSQEDDSTVIVNSLLCLLSFCDRSILPALFKEYTSKIDIKDFVEYAGDGINEYAKDIILYLDDDSKMVFIEALATTLRRDAIFDIFEKVESCRGLAAIGLLYMMSEREIIKWLKIKKIEEKLNRDQVEKAKKLQVQYGWKKKLLSEEDITCLYQIIYLCKEQILEGASLKNISFDHRISFLLCYIVSKESKEVYQDLIINNGFRIKSLIEFTFHWDRYVKKRNKWKVQYWFISTAIINRIIIVLELGLLFFHMLVYVQYCSKLYVIKSEGWFIDNKLIDYFSLLSFNSEYILFVIGCFFALWFLNFLIQKMNYGFISKVLSICVAFGLSFLYMFFVYDLFFRFSLIVVLILVTALETLKHRSNYPTLKEPQYSLVIYYLNT